MDIQSVLDQVDIYFEENKGEEAEKLMRDAVVQAVQEQDDNSLLQLLNELVGYYREAGQAENSFQMAGQAIAQAERMGLAGTVPYATTLLNAANAYRAGGKLQESLETYQKVQEIYDAQLEKDHIFVAGLQNNMSLLYQEMQRYAEAEECQLRALEIVRSKEAFYETGVTYANLASTCVQLGKTKEAEGYAVSSMETFQKIGVKDSHYGAALAALGDCHYEREEYDMAGDYY
ncbi:MAG: tetratricopeptide repeat protein, partial [Acetatifactor sp.]|nr:tetratricopeptide repeat protein [Acetatifactor sp.]